MGRYTHPETQWVNSNGAPLAGGKLYFYVTGTSTPLETYSNSALTSANTNPMVANASGFFGDVWLKSDLQYKVVLTDADDVQVWSADPIGLVVVYPNAFAALTNIAAMTAQVKSSLTDGVQVHVGGRTAVGDGGGGTFYWHDGSSTRVDSGTVFASDEGGTGRWKRVVTSPFNAKWFGATGDGSTDDHAALQACFTTAVASNQTAVHVPRGTYMLSRTLKIGAVSLIGDGAVATTFKPRQPFTGSAVLLVDDTVGTAGVNSMYTNFRIDGNRSALSTTVACLKLEGNVLYNQFSNIRINEAKGVGVLIEGKAGPVRPTLNAFTNVSVNGGDTHGWQFNAGRHSSLIDCAAENLGGTAFWFRGNTEAVANIVVTNPYVEVVDGSGFLIDGGPGASGSVHIINPLVNGYGTNAVAYGVHFNGSFFCKLAGGVFYRNSPDHANSRHIRFGGGVGNLAEQLGSQITSDEIEYVSGGAVVGTYQNVTNKIQYHLTNAEGAMGPGSRAYINTNGARSGTYASVSMPVSGRFLVRDLQFKSATAAGGAETFTVALVKNGMDTAMVAVSAAGGSTGSDAADVEFVSGDTWAVRFLGSARAATVNAYELVVTIGGELY